MSKTLSKSLSLDLAGLAQLIKSQGRKGDTVLAHITPKEAALLKRRGGAGSINPHTGLPEYDDGEFDSGGGFDSGGAMAQDTYTAPVEQPVEQPVQDNVQSAIQTDTGISSPYSAPAGYDAAAAPVDQSVEQPAFDSSFTQQGAFDPTSTTGGQPQTGGAGGVDTTATKDKSWWQQALDAAGGASGILGNLAKAGVLGGVGAYGAKQAQTAAQQGQAAADKIGAMAVPVQARSAAAQQQLGDIAAQTQAAGVNTAQQVRDLGALPLQVGTQMVQSAQAGALTPSNQQALDALRAQNQQNISKRGGVGAMQAGVSEQNARAALGERQLTQGLSTYQQGAAYGLTAAQYEQAQANLANQIRTSAINTALTQSGIADQYTMQAIMTGLASDQQLATNMQNFYAKLAQIGFGTAMNTGSTATRATV